MPNAWAVSAQRPNLATILPSTPNGSAGLIRRQSESAESVAVFGNLAPRIYVRRILKSARPLFGFWPDKRKTTYLVTFIGKSIKTFKLWLTQVGFPRTNKAETGTIPYNGQVRNTRDVRPVKRRRYFRRRASNPKPLRSYRRERLNSLQLTIPRPFQRQAER